jgi:hypothetical protein
LIRIYRNFEGKIGFLRVKKIHGSEKRNLPFIYSYRPSPNNKKKENRCGNIGPV